MKNMTFALIILCTCVTNNLDAAEFIARLDNGMDVVLVENHSVPMIAANIIIKTGGRDESWETWGAAHFLEHLLFNGTHSRTQDEIYSAFDRLGAYHNAHTGSHFTDFMLLSSRDNFLSGFEILTDMVFNSTLPEEKFEKERGIVIEEIARSATMSDNSARLFKECLFGEGQLSRNVLGTVDGISRLRRSDVLDFYKVNYIPNNMMLFVTGSFSSDTLFSKLQEALSGFEPRRLPERDKVNTPDYRLLGKLGIVRRSTSDETLKITVGMNAPRVDDPDFISFLMLSMLIDKRFETEFEPGVRVSGGSVLDPDLSYYEINIRASAKSDDVEQMLKTLDEVIRLMATEPPSQEEITLAARNFKTDRVFNAERLHYYGIMYSHYWALVSWDEFRSWPDRLEQVTPLQVTDAAQRWLRTDERLIMIFEPTSEPIPDSTTVSGTTFVKKTTEEGLTVIARQDATARVFGMHILVKDRWLWDREFGVGSVDLIHQIISESLRDPENGYTAKLEQISARVKAVDSPFIPYDNYYTVPDYSFLRFEVLPEYWEDGVDLIADLIANLPFDQAVIESAASSHENARVKSSRSPAGSGIRHLRRHLLPETALSASVYGDEPVRDVKRLKQLRDGLFQPRNLIISTAGPVEAETAAAAIAKAFKALTDDSVDLPSREATPPPEDNEKTNDTLSLGLPQGAVVYSHIIRSIPESDMAALFVANAWYSNFMGMELRERQGLAYSLGSSIRFRNSSEGVWGLWEISISTRPENLAKATQGIDETLSEYMNHKFTSDEVERLKNQITGRLSMRNMSRIGHSYSMGTGEYFWQNPQHSKHMRDRLKGVSVDDITTAVKRYLSEKQADRVIVN